MTHYISTNIFLTCVFILAFAYFVGLIIGDIEFDERIDRSIAIIFGAIWLIAPIVAFISAIIAVWTR